MNLICNKNCCKIKTNSSYIKKILEILGPVIFGSKPSEILNISGKEDMKKIKLKEIESFFSNCTKVNYEIINTYDGGIRILFINKSSLSNVFTNKKCLSFFKFLGYPCNYEMDTYINILIDRLHSPEFPNEIGIFLGYPLKDVLGFMGYGKNKLSDTRFWKIYGDTSISYEVSEKFLKDKAIMRKLLNTKSINELKDVI